MLRKLFLNNKLIYTDTFEFLVTPFRKKINSLFHLKYALNLTHDFFMTISIRKFNFFL